MITIDENGVAYEYDDTWDITIHCETEEEHNRVLEILAKSLESSVIKGV